MQKFKDYFTLRENQAVAQPPQQQVAPQQAGGQPQMDPQDAQVAGQLMQSLGKVRFNTPALQKPFAAFLQLLQQTAQSAQQAAQAAPQGQQAPAQAAPQGQPVQAQPQAQ